MRHWLAVLAVVISSVALWAVLGPGYVGYDAAWSLVWGSQIVAGERPSYDADVAPTPHPLANAVGAVLSPLRDGGADALVALSFLAFAALLAGMIDLGRRLACWPAGVVGALVLGTGGLLDREVAFASIDIPFLALVVWAVALKIGSARRGWPVLALLWVAGLLRPEAWLLSAGYCIWLAAGRPRRTQMRLGLLAAGAPIIWALSDLAITGDPLHSLTGTRALADSLGRDTGLGAAVAALPTGLTDLMGTSALAAGVLGLGAGLVVAPRRTAILLVVGCASVATFVVTGAAGLPVLERYLLVPSMMLAAAAGLGAGLARLGCRPRPRARARGTVMVMVSVLLIAGIPQTVRRIRDAREFTAARAAVQRDLRSLSGSPAFRRAMRDCPQVFVPDFRARPVLLLAGGGDPAHIAVGNLADGKRALLLTYASDAAAFIFNLGAPGEVALQAAPRGARQIAANRSWVAYEVC